ncbi:non-heme ferritin [Photorhabdus heterorhabditis]|uniref:Ferritin n=1 Tax=Photorhabdus heterorhabditis TaxID=880156 RepID=A0A5B0WLC5_9GAMM|nr:non-heme ferritin [Photorhabdus heterorhabditis]KAA1186749.1 non-heme ferritin [Photorhabdus heterorhabditis]KOY63441.1 ferritin [Photorhabdus heterorhabditis]MBS9442226.1 non-heme ferritin [Photorhabdus heterorhabditis]
MLNQEMVNKLNEQMNLEFYSANLYLQMSAWCCDKGLAGAAAFFKSHAQEEMQHMHRLFDYLSDTGTMPRLGRIDAPSTDYESVSHVLNKTYEHEKFITSEINKLAHLAITTQDYSTFNFLQWYVAEQHEEEKLFKSILDKLEMVGEDGKALFLLDKDLKGLAAANPI